VFEQRLADIAATEAYLARQGTLILKFFLHVSREEQRRRFLERIEDPAKNWKFDPRDIAERARWDEYMAAYEAAIRATAAPHAPWFVVPADAKWFTRLVVAAAIGEALRGLGLAYPEPDAAQRAALDAARIALGG
jgi:polyphosphate kinase 2 (PPK2 family)